MRIAGRELGTRAFIAFEIGPSVAGLDSGLALTDAAAQAGADAIKWQVLNAARLVGRDVPVTFGTAAGTETKPMAEILARRALRPDEWFEMAEAARRRALGIIATVDYPETLKLALDVGVDAIKVCSGDVTHLDWIRQIAESIREHPRRRRDEEAIMLDTGSAGLGEIEQAVDACLEAGHERIVVVHCPSGYPARAESINLRMLTTLRQALGETCAIGFSDHTQDADMDIAALALGAQYIEKNLVLDRSLPWPEHTMAVEPGEAVAFVRRLREAETALGHPRRVLTSAEARAKARARRSAFARTDLAAGTQVPADAIEWRRPAEAGIEPAEWRHFKTRVLRHPVKQGEQITAEGFT